jgi:hypothetical protein
MTLAPTFLATATGYRFVSEVKHFGRVGTVQIIRWVRDRGARCSPEAF